MATVLGWAVSLGRVEPTNKATECGSACWVAHDSILGGEPRYRQCVNKKIAARCLQWTMYSVEGEAYAAHAAVHACSSSFISFPAWRSCLPTKSWFECLEYCGLRHLGSSMRPLIPSTRTAKLGIYTADNTSTKRQVEATMHTLRENHTRLIQGLHSTAFEE